MRQNLGVEVNLLNRGLLDLWSFVHSGMAEVLVIELDVFDIFITLFSLVSGT